MKIKSINPVGQLPVYDITVKDVHHYALQNGVVTHNTALTYSSNQIFVISKAQEKDSDGDLDGWKFTINIHKSRFVREKAKLPFVVKYDGGIQKYSGLMDIALENGAVIKPKMGWYSKVNLETGEVDTKLYRLKDTENTAFWKPVLDNPLFQKKIEEAYMVSQGSIMSNMEIDEEMDNV